jgi:DNA-binding NarL/FixJ family response regulator
MTSIPKLIMIGFEPILHHLLRHRLEVDFAIVGAAWTAAEALALARDRFANVVLIDADSAGTRAADLIAKLSLVGRAPIVALSACAAPAKLDTAALLAAGARAIVHKAAGSLPLDLPNGLGERLITVLLRVAQP